MGSAQILDAILNEARRDAEAIIADAKSTAQDTLRAAKADAQAHADLLLDDTEKAAVITAERDMLAAELEARKASLQSRRAILDSVFDEAVDRLCALGKKDYIALVTRLVVQSAESGAEQLQVPKTEADRYIKPYDGGKTMLQLLNEKLTAAGKNGALSLYAEPGDFKGGVKLIGKQADIDCSFESLVRAYRDAHEGDVSRLLFGQKED